MAAGVGEEKASVGVVAERSGGGEGGRGAGTAGAGVAVGDSGVLLAGTGGVGLVEISAGWDGVVLGVADDVGIEVSLRSGVSIGCGCRLMSLVAVAAGVDG